MKFLSKCQTLLLRKCIWKCYTQMAAILFRPQFLFLLSSLTRTGCRGSLIVIRFSRQHFEMNFHQRKVFVFEINCLSLFLWVDNGSTLVKVGAIKQQAISTRNSVEQHHQHCIWSLGNNELTRYKTSTKTARHCIGKLHNFKDKFLNINIWEFRLSLVSWNLIFHTSFA